MNQRPATGRHVVVAGGSFAGLAAAYAAREALGKEDRVTLISPGGQFTFAPSLIWAALGRPLVHSSFALEPALAKRRIDFVRSHVREVDIADHKVRTSDGEMSYDRLVIATGGQPDKASVPGLAGEFRAASWIVGEESAMEAGNLLRHLVEDPGPLVLGVAQGAGYMSAAYELALAMDTVLLRKGVRDDVPITFITSEPYLCHLGFGQSAAKSQVEKLFAERNIATRVGMSISQVRPHEVVLASGEVLPAKAIVIMPPFTGVVDMWKSAGLTDSTGLIPVDETYRHVEHPDIYAAGVASYFRSPTPPLGFGHAPHTGYLSIRMGKAAGQNAAASMVAGQPASRPLPYVLDLRILDGGETGMVLASWGEKQLRHAARPLPGAVAHRLKAAVERYLIWRLRTGKMNLP